MSQDGGSMESYIDKLITAPFRTQQGERRKTTESFLETLSAAFMDANSLNSQVDYDIVRMHAAPDFEMANGSVHECAFPRTASLESHLSNVEKMKRENPAWRIAAYNFTAELAKDDKHAVVWFTSKGTGGPAGRNTNRESVSMLFWRKRKPDGAWETYKHTCLRGPGNIFDEREDSTVLSPACENTESGVK